MMCFSQIVTRKYHFDIIAMTIVPSQQEGPGFESEPGHFCAVVRRRKLRCYNKSGLLNSYPLRPQFNSNAFIQIRFVHFVNFE